MRDRENIDRIYAILHEENVKHARIYGHGQTVRRKEPSDEKDNDAPISDTDRQRKPRKQRLEMMFA